MEPEITLLGQNVNAYQNEKFRLSNLILEIEKFRDLKNKMHHSHPKDMTDDLIVYSFQKINATSSSSYSKWIQ